MHAVIRWLGEMHKNKLSLSFSIAHGNHHLCQRRLSSPLLPCQKKEEEKNPAKSSHTAAQFARKWAKARLSPLYPSNPDLKSWIWSQELGAQTPWQAGGAGWGMCCWFHSVTDALQLHRSTQIPQSLISTHSTCWQQVLHRDCWRRQPHLSVYYSFVMFAVNKGRRRQHFQNKSLLKLFVCVFWMCNYESILRHQGMKFQYGFRKQAPYKRGSSEHHG